jgi:hypothetical protein
MGAITAALGPYSQIVRGRDHQKKILKDFPWLWAIFPAWPFEGDFLVSNDRKKLLRFLGANPLASPRSVDAVWLVVEKPDGFFLSFKLFAWMDKHQHQAVCIRHTWAGNILDEAARYGRIKNIAIVRNAESREEAQVIVYRLSKTLLSFEDACREAM